MTSRGIASSRSATRTATACGSRPAARDLTRRRSAYRSIASLQRDNRVCRACAEAGYPIESLPVVQPYTGQRAYMFGQAPGDQEGVERLPWRAAQVRRCAAGWG